MKRYLLSAIAGGALMLGSAYAQSQTGTPTPGTEEKAAEQVHSDRNQMQKDRITNGVKSGELTKQQAKDLGGYEKSINQHAAAMKAQNGGTLSRAQQRQVRQAMNRQSARIARTKH